MKNFKAYAGVFLLLLSVFPGREAENVETTTISAGNHPEGTSTTAGDTTATATVVGDTTATPTTASTTNELTTLAQISTGIDDVKSHEPRSATVSSKRAGKPPKRPSYIYTLRINPSKKPDAPKEYHGLLIGRHVVATIRVPNFKGAELCIDDNCETTKKIKETDNFAYWRLDGKRRGPIIFTGYRYKNKECVVNSDDQTAILMGTNDKIECEPECKTGDVVVCDTLATGIVKGKKEELALFTVKQLAADGGFGKRGVGIGRRSQRRKLPKKLSKKGKQEEEEEAE